ncbi:MAG TPA: PilZ domain-containing protein [Terriglobales bacterium]|nr:PilZ domain-containing protein [Terriglobales bacterium]
MLKQVQRAVDVMRSAPEQGRSSVRIYVPIPAEVICIVQKGQPCPGLVRDINATGAHFHSGITPEVGSEVTIDFAFPSTGKRIKLSCQGVAVRVEPSPHGGATSAAIEFRRHDLAVPY